MEGEREDGLEAKRVIFFFFLKVVLPGERGEMSTWGGRNRKTESRTVTALGVRIPWPKSFNGEHIGR